MYSGLIINADIQLSSAHEENTHEVGSCCFRGGLIGVGASGWADLKCPIGLVPGKELDGAGVPVCLSLTNTLTCSAPLKASMHSHTVPGCLCLWAAGWIVLPPSCPVLNLTSTHSWRTQTYYWREFIGPFVLQDLIDIGSGWVELGQIAGPCGPGQTELGINHKICGWESRREVESPWCEEENPDYRKAVHKN